MVIFRKELKRNFRGWLTWTAIVIATVGLMMTFYPMFADNAAKIDSLLSAYPKGMLAAFNLDQLKMSDVMGFYATETYTFMLLLASIYAILLAGGLIAKEESDRTIEFLLAKPVTRREIITAKGLVALVYILLLNVVQFATAWIGIELVKRTSYSFRTLVLLVIAATVLQLLFAAIGLLVSVFLPKIRSLYSAAIGIVMGAYFLDLMVKLSDKLAWLKWGSPFQYANSTDIVVKASLNGAYMAIAVCVAAVSVAATYWFYQKKDITA